MIDINKLKYYRHAAEVVIERYPNDVDESIIKVKAVDLFEMTDKLIKKAEKKQRGTGKSEENSE